MRYVWIEMETGVPVCLGGGVFFTGGIFWKNDKKSSKNVLKSADHWRKGWLRFLYHMNSYITGLVNTMQTKRTKYRYDFQNSINHYEKSRDSFFSRNASAGL